MHVVGGVEYVQKAHGPKARGYKSKKGEIWIQPRVYSYKRSKWGTEKRWSQKILLGHKARPANDPRTCLVHGRG